MSKIQLRRDTAANWTSANPTLAPGELGFETDTGKFKIGNAAGTAWTSLSYAAATSYNDLTNTPTPYSLPTASTTVLGGVKVDGTSVTILGGVISVSTNYAGLGANTFTGTQALGGNLLTQPKLQAYRETFTTPSISAGTLTLDLSGSNVFSVALNAAITTLTISNTPASAVSCFVLRFTADGTARAVAWPASVTWSAGSTPSLTSTNGKRDEFAFESFDGGTSWTGYILGQNF